MARRRRKQTEQPAEKYVRDLRVKVRQIRERALVDPEYRALLERTAQNLRLAPLQAEFRLDQEEASEPVTDKVEKEPVRDFVLKWGRIEFKRTFIDGVWHSTELFVHSREDEGSPLEPPSLGKFLIVLFFRKKEREALLGDLEEEFYEVAAEFGAPKARLWYRAQVLRSLWPFIAAGCRALWKMGVVGTIGSWIGKLIR